MKNIIMIIIGVACLGMLACNQQEDISGKVEAEVNDRAEAMIDSLKRVCNTNFDTALQNKVTAAIKAKNQPAVQAKPSIKANNKPKTTQIIISRAKTFRTIWARLSVIRAS